MSGFLKSWGSSLDSETRSVAKSGKPRRPMTHRKTMGHRQNVKRNKITNHTLVSIACGSVNLRLHYLQILAKTLQNSDAKMVALSCSSAELKSFKST